MRVLTCLFTILMMMTGLCTQASAQTLEVSPAGLSTSLSKKGLTATVLSRNGQDYVRFSIADWADYYLLFNDCDPAQKCKRLLFFSQDESPNDQSVEEIRKDVAVWPKSDYVTGELKHWPNRNLQVMSDLTLDNRLTISMSTPTPSAMLDEKEFWALVDLWIRLDDDFFLGY
ncbi:MAG: hypothetical protein AAGC58_04210 [Asticcacaulis sp.]